MNAPQVPVPVVVMSPQYFQAEDLLSAGSTMIYLTNVGLIAAQDVTLTLPGLQVCTACSQPRLTCVRIGAYFICCAAIA